MDFQRLTPCECDVAGARGPWEGLSQTVDAGCPELSPGKAKTRVRGSWKEPTTADILEQAPRMIHLGPPDK